MIAGWRAIQDTGTTKDWCWVGLWMGLGFLSKYTALLQWVCWAVFFVLWPPARKHLRLDTSLRAAIDLLLQGKSIEEVCQAVGRARSTVTEYLAELVASHGISDPTAWIDDDLFTRIRAAAKQHGLDRLKPLYEALGGTVSYDQLRIAVACLRNAAPESR